ncbi:MAG: hypothetical protein ACR2G0_04020 [Chthoniobacterales bacterium]
MIRSRRDSAFALAVTLVLLALIVIVLVAYLANTRSDRSTASIYAYRLRAAMFAESGLAAATKLLADNTRYGNYVTAMPAPFPSPAQCYTELYRPTDPADTKVAKADDFLQLTNAAGVILTSRATTTAISQVDPRPVPEMIPSAGPFAMTDPGFTTADSYDFNQIVRLGSNASGRLVRPSPTPAYGQWVRVRNSDNELTGRYAFFMEDESMKTNVNVTGNNLASGFNLRINDLTLPLPAPAPATQLEEVDPAAVLPLADNRNAADAALTGVTAAGSRLPSRSSLALLNEWSSNFSDYAHLITALSKDDQTTAKGWQRMDLNAVVAAATTNADKIAVAQRVADWIRDAWTGPAISGLKSYQMFDDPRLRLQIAANIIDYIDADNTPTDLGNYPSIGVFPVNPAEYPVIGIEKIPYLVAVEIIYEASGSNGVTTATLKTKIQFRFMNMYESDLDLVGSLGRIEVQGVPIVSRNGATVLDVSTTNYVIPFASLTPVTPGNTIIPAGVDGDSVSGAKTFTTDWLVNQSVSFNGAGTVKPVLLAGGITVKEFGPGGERVDDTAIATNLISTGYNYNGSSSTGDFLKDSTNGALQIASINTLYQVPTGTTTAINTGDPRVRGTILNNRWYNISRSDATTPSDTNRIAAYIDKAEIANRTYALDWYDWVGNRPLAFHRNGPLRSVGELGNVTAAEYPWRTIYLQYPERLPNTTQIGPLTEIPQRRNGSVDYILMDLFCTQTSQPRAGAVNINTQQRVATQQHPLGSLFLAESIGSLPGPTPIQNISQTVVDRFCDATGSGTISPIFSRRTAVGPPADNTPVRPFFQIGELASVLSRMVNTSSGGSTTGTPVRSAVSYSALRPTSGTANGADRNFRSDIYAEQEYREVSDSITTRGNVFRVLYVGQSVKDLNADGIVTANEVQSEHLGEAFIERQSVFAPEGSNPDAMKTASSIYKIISNRVVTQ